MKFKGKLLDVFQNYKTKHYQIVLDADTEAVEAFEALADKDLSVELKTWREGRSLSANSFFHVLCDKIAKAQTPTLSMNYCKNILVGRYGVQDYLEDGETPIVIKTNIEPKEMLEQEHLHCRVAQGGDENTWFYFVMKPTHLYDTKEMSDLISGTVEEAKALGIDTITQREIDEMMQRYGIEWEKKHEGK